VKATGIPAEIALCKIDRRRFTRRFEFHPAEEKEKEEQCVGFSMA
jgi:hypothetical protein